MRSGRITRAGLCCVVVLGVLGLAPESARAGLADFQTWTQVQDPADPHFSGIATATQVVLSASGGPVPGGTDIGYQSVDGRTAVSSGLGHAFSPGADFSLAVDFAVTFGNTPLGTLGLGFGIGEDIDGMNSAGVALLFNNGIPWIAFGAAARVDDANQVPAVIGVPASATGSMFVSYQAATGNVILGASQTQGAAGPTGIATFSGIQNRWGDRDLLVSLFLRSDGTLSTPWQSGSAEARFSDLRVLSGTPSAVPDPTPLVLLGPGLAVLVARRGRHRPRSQGPIPV